MAGPDPATQRARLCGRRRLTGAAITVRRHQVEKGEFESV